MTMKESETIRMTDEEMIDTLKGLVFGTFDRTTRKEREALDLAIKVLEKAKWIPVSERLPDERKDCIVTFKDGYVDTMYYAPDLYKVDEFDFCTKKGKAGWYNCDSEWGYYSREDIIAWMPLPKPYNAESEE